MCVAVENEPENGAEAKPVRHTAQLPPRTSSSGEGAASALASLRNQEQADAEGRCRPWPGEADPVEPDQA
jgi:hypothetical protein